MNTYLVQDEQSTPERITCGGGGRAVIMGCVNPVRAMDTDAAMGLALLLFGFSIY